MSPDSDASVNLSVPSSPVRGSDTDTDDRETSGRSSPRTPMREDLARKVLADENASAQDLRDALQQQVDKYKRLSSYLLSLTERHALERAELVHKVELLERERERREREMKGLKWIVAHSGSEGEPARKDSDVMPPPSRSSSAARDRSGSAATSRTNGSVVVSSPGTDGPGRMSMDSAVGSVEEGLAELQSSISEFIAPEKQQQQQPPGVSRGPVAARRRARSNTVPNGAPAMQAMQTAVAVAPTPAAKLALNAKVARRTSSPVIPYSGPLGGFAQRRPPGPGTRTGLGLGLDGASSSLPALTRSPSPENRVDLHARSDSSTLSSLPSLSTIHSSSPSSGLSSIPETPRTDVALLDDDSHAHLNVDGKDSPNPHRLSTSSTSSLSSGTGSGVSAGSSRVSASPSISQVLDRTKAKSSIPARSHHQPEMEAILRRLRAFGQSHSP